MQRTWEPVLSTARNGAGLRASALVGQFAWQGVAAPCDLCGWHLAVDVKVLHGRILLTGNNTDGLLRRLDVDGMQEVAGTGTALACMYRRAVNEWRALAMQPRGGASWGRRARQSSIHLIAGPWLVCSHGWPMAGLHFVKVVCLSQHRRLTARIVSASCYDSNLAGCTRNQTAKKVLQLQYTPRWLPCMGPGHVAQPTTNTVHTVSAHPGTPGPLAKCSPTRAR